MFYAGYCHPIESIFFIKFVKSDLNRKIFTDPVVCFVKVLVYYYLSSSNVENIGDWINSKIKPASGSVKSVSDFQDYWCCASAVFFRYFSSEFFVQDVVQIAFLISCTLSFSHRLVAVFRKLESDML